MMTNQGLTAAGRIALQNLQLATRPVSMRGPLFYNMGNNILRNAQKGNLNNQETMMLSNNVTAKAQAHNAQNPGTNLMFTLGQLAGRYNESMKQDRDYWRQKGSNLVHNIMAFNPYIASYTNNALMLGAQNAAAVTAGAGGGYNFGGNPQQFSMQQPPMYQFPVPQVQPASQYPYDPRQAIGMPTAQQMAMNTAGAYHNPYNMPQGQPQQQQQQHSLLSNPNNKSFQPKMDFANREDILLEAAGGSFSATKKVAKKLEDLKNDYQNTDSLAKKQKSIDLAANILGNQAGNIQRKLPNGAYEPLSQYLQDGETAKEFARSFLQTGVEESDNDQRLEGLYSIGISNHSDIEAFENLISVDEINTYVDLLDRLGGGRSLTEAIKRNTKENDSENAEELYEEVVSTLGSNNDQSGMYSSQIETLDRIFKKRPEGVSTEEMAEKLSDAVRGVASKVNNNPELLQKDDHIRIKPDKVEDRQITGRILPTSTHPSCLDRMFHGISDSHKVALEIDEVKHGDNGNWSGKIRFRDSDGEISVFDLEQDLQGKDAGSFSYAFKDIYESFLEAGKDNRKYLHSTSGDLKYKLADLDEVLKKMKEKNLSKPPSYFDEDEEDKHNNDLTSTDGMVAEPTPRRSGNVGSPPAKEGGGFNIGSALGSLGNMFGRGGGSSSNGAGG